MQKIEKKYKKRINELISACKDRFSEDKEIALIRAEFLPKKQAMIKWLTDKDRTDLLDDFIFETMGKKVLLYLQDAYHEELDEVLNNLPEIILPCPHCGDKDHIFEISNNDYGCQIQGCVLSKIDRFPDVESWNIFVNTLKGNKKPEKQCFSYEDE